MGCDIHLHAEVKIGGQWHHYAAPNVNRSYRLFAYMADVRNYDDEIEPVAAPRGLPADITAVTALDLDLWDDGHHRSWLGADEIAKVERFIEKLYNDPADTWRSNRDHFGYFFGNDFGCRESWPRGVEDVRFVFWFDN